MKTGGGCRGIPGGAGTHHSPLPPKKHSREEMATVGPAGESCPTAGTTFPGGKARKKGGVHGPAALGVAPHACVHASHLLCPQTLPGRPTVCAAPQHKTCSLSSSPHPEAPAPYQPCGLQGLVLRSRDRAGSAITLTILRGFPWGKVRAMLGAKAHPEATRAGPAALQQPSQPLCRVKPCETHLSSRLVATQTLSITYSGTVSARGQAGAMRGVTKPARAYAFSALGCKPLCRGRVERALHPSRASAPCASTALHLENASRIIHAPAVHRCYIQLRNQLSKLRLSGQRLVWTCSMSLAETEKWEAGPAHAVGQRSSPLQLPLCLKAGKQL